MKSAIRQIAGCWRGNNSFDERLIFEAVNELKFSSEFRDAVNRLTTPGRKLSYHELTDDTERRVSVAFAADNWTVSVGMDYKVGGEVTLSPYPMIIVPAQGACLEIDLYEYACENFSRSFCPDLRLGEPRRRITVRDGEFWATPSRGVFAEIVGISGDYDQEPVIMVVTGDAYAPYVRVFDRSGRLASTVFSSNFFNGQQFFADFLRNVAATDLIDCMSEQERLDLEAFVVKQLSRPSELISEALWPMIQTAAKLDHMIGLAALREIAKSSHEMAAHAAAVLKRHVSNEKVLDRA